MEQLFDYYRKYPELILDILEYFWLDADFNNKNIIGFCSHNRYNEVFQPDIVLKICDKLAENRVMSLNFRGGALEGKTSYSFVWRKGKEKWDKSKYTLLHHYNSMVYGFEYIYHYFSDKVIPIVAYKGGDRSMGTVFKFHNGLITARHCIEEHDSYMIKGYTAQQLQSAPIFVSKNPAIDIAYIHTGEPSEEYCDDPKVLDEVLVMGYPRVALFLNFLTAEKATISTMVKARMTPSRGSIAATAKTIWTGEQDLLLITAKIKGGNSGGPIINNRGCVVGVAFADPSAEGLYDEIGYGVGMPIQVLDDIIREGITTTVNFIDWNEE